MHTVIHQILSQNGKKWEFVEKVFSLTQIVRINSVTSERQMAEYGVLQGTMVGPILFSIYIDELV